MDVVARVTAMGGAARAAEILKLGHTRRELAEAVASRRLTRVVRGLYAAPGVDRTSLLAALFRARVTCVSALAAHGVALLSRPQLIHLEVSRGFSAHDRSMQGIQVHFGGDSAPSGIASVPRAIAVASGCLKASEHLVAFDSALHSGQINLADIGRWRSITTANDAKASPDVNGEPRGPSGLTEGVRFPRARRDWLLTHADGRADSPLETLVRLEIVEAGFSVQPQCFVEGVGRVDLMVEGVLVVETDGREHHDDPRAFQRDRDRDRKLVRAGFRVLRFTYADIVGPRAVDVAEEVREALAAVRPGRIRQRILRLSAPTGADPEK